MRVPRIMLAGVAGAGSLLLAVGGAVPAMAHSRPSSPAALAGVRFAPAKNATSTTFAGWTFKASKSVTSEFKVPSLKCTKTDSGVGPISVLVTGTSSASNFNAAGLLLECVSGKPAAAPAVVVDGAATTGTQKVSVGDVIQGTVTTTAKKTTATVADLTKGHTFKLTKSGKGAAGLEALIIDDSLVNSSTGKQLPVANFGKIQFTNGAVDGKALGSASGGKAYNMQTKKGVLQILTGPLTGAKKNAFLTTWKHS
jgi:hypothetical protein